MAHHSVPDKKKKTASKFWDDNYLDSHIIYKYRAVAESQQLDIASEFLHYLFLGHDDPHTQHESLLYSAASLLRAPDVPQHMLLQHKLNKPEMEAHVCVFRYDTSKFLKHFPAEFQLFLVENGELGLIPYAAFLATILLRLSVKPTQTVTTYIEAKAATKFKEYFPTFFMFTKKFPLSEKALKYFTGIVKLSKPRFVNHMCLVLKTFKEYPSSNVRSYLYDLILTHTSYHGLKLIRDFKAVEAHWDGCSAVLIKCLKAFQKAKDTAELLERFEEHYGDRRHLLWKWAKLVDSCYLKNYAIMKHTYVGAIFVALLEPFDGPDVWKCTFLKDVPTTVIDDAKNIGKQIKPILDVAKAETKEEDDETEDDSDSDDEDTPPDSAAGSSSSLHNTIENIKHVQL